MRRRVFLGFAAAGFTGTSGCIGNGENDRPTSLGETLRLATATSTYDTGLVTDINAAFTRRYGAVVDAIALGTGAVLETGRRGDADLLLVHARPLEDEFIRQGYGINRRDVMVNDFVLLGPPTDPADIAGGERASDAFSKIAALELPFVSRGDNSGTHVKERELWELAGIEPTGAWYREAGSGMGEVLMQTDLTQDAYTLSDRGTFLSMRQELDLAIHVQGPIEGGSPRLRNPYGILAVNPGHHDQVEYELAMAYIGFVTSPAGQTLIAEYAVGGERLFYPDAVTADPNFEQHVPAGWGDERTK